MNQSARIFDDALAALNRGDPGQAEKHFRQLLRRDAAHVPALNLLTIVLMGQGRFAEAEAFIAAAVALNQTSDVSFYNYGLICHNLGKHGEAYGHFSRALDLNAGVAETWNNRGAASNALKNYDAALGDFDRAIALNANYADAFANRGKSLLELKRNADALVAFQQAIALRGDLARAWLGLGSALGFLNRLEEAIEPLSRALALAPDLAEARLARGLVFSSLKRNREAILDYDEAFKIRPDLPIVEGLRLGTRMHCCDWAAYAADSRHLLETVRVSRAAIYPYSIVGIESTAEDQFRCARTWIENLAPPDRQPQTAAPSRPRIDVREKIRVGYLSYDFRDHAIAYLTAGLFEAHDKNRFEVLALSTGPDDNSAIRKRTERSVSSFVDLSNAGDAEIAETIRGLDVDLLLDVNGFTSGERNGVLRRRPSPVQINYLGYPGTLGADFIDYIIADPLVIPESQRRFYSEKVVTLPHTYQATDRTRPISSKNLTRADFGLPEDGFVFCCFNNVFKITPDTFGCWMSILRRIDGSVLWLFEESLAARENLSREALAYGIDPARLIVARRLPQDEHLARHRLADLFLDTFPYNAHTTASDALWAGLPVLTRKGETFASRVAASLLQAIGMPEMVADSRDEFEEMAVALASDPQRIDGLKAKLNQNRLTTPLFDTALYTRHLEAAFDAMHKRHHAGQPPDHILITPGTLSQNR